MCVRERTEQEEAERLSPYAALARNSQGRARQESEDELRTCFQRDRDRLLHCKAFRRLKHKTQVFYSPEGDHYRTRLTHTLEVSQIARTMARALRLNEDLTEAIALGHDLGHTPFGHSGEAALNEVLPGGFRHNVQSLRVVEHVERREGKTERGLNLTLEVRDGILCHSADWPEQARTLEGQIVRMADKIAYVNHDVDDAMRAGIITEEMVPDLARRVLGPTRRERLNTLVNDLIEQSEGKPVVSQSDEVARAMASLRDFMFERVYVGSVAKAEGDKARALLVQLFHYYLEHPEELARDAGEISAMEDPIQTVVD
ncbi:MAG: deoxyguanosinetriphosphate triphosphohydrolase, partial [Firmicutes bacterium]|nr:deoxyguanosinetriphosphate triphosphohydrolase [Bacillota bacterium]